MEMILQLFSNLTTSLFICQGDFHLKAKIVHLQYFSLYVEGKSYKISIALDILNSNYQLRFINSLFCLLFSNLLQLMINITLTKYILVSLINENPVSFRISVSIIQIPKKHCILLLARRDRGSVKVGSRNELSDPLDVTLQRNVNTQINQV